MTVSLIARPYFAHESPFLSMIGQLNMNSKSLGTLLIALSVLGCGGGGESRDGAADDSSDGAHVSGTVSVGGEPVKYGSITFMSFEEEGSDEAEVSSAFIRDGKFNTRDTRHAPVPGENTVTVDIYESDPESGEPDTIGMWDDKVRIEAGQSITLDIDPDDVLKLGS